MLELPMTDHFTRYAVALSLQYRRPGTSIAHPGVGWTRDLSPRGAWVELPEAFELLADLEIRLRMPGAAPWLGAQVVWVRPEPTRKHLYLHGLAFARVTPAQRQTLQDLLAQQKERGAVRRYCTLTVTCLRQDGERASLPGRTRDLSRSGVAVRLPEPVPPGTPMRVTLPTTFGTVTAEARVVWGEVPEPRPAGAPYRHGLQFLRFGPSELPLSLLLAGLR